ncbi:hypothetical protein AYI68_g2448 [Smittium mucronatum]|uniref:Uncharacterized protein n=1 Tax=Smittium mucronatum TaxID=133383 RepID=A0A1R0H2M1_9FUNG|nr:hypothetical protein AYI68_g2448 [Smittium mucronatum]
MGITVTARLKNGGFFVAGERLDCILTFSNDPFSKRDSSVSVNSSSPRFQPGASNSTFNTRKPSSTGVQSNSNSKMYISNIGHNGLNPRRSISARNRSGSLNSQNLSQTKEYRALGLAQLNGVAFTNSSLIKDSSLSDIKNFEINPAINQFSERSLSSMSFDSTDSRITRGSESETIPRALKNPESFWSWISNSPKNSEDYQNRNSSRLGGGFSEKMKVISENGSKYSRESNQKLSFYQTPTEIIFSELNLEFGQSKSFILSTFLEKSIPSSFRGKTLKIEYELVIFIKKKILDNHSFIIHIPFFVNSRSINVDNNNWNNNSSLFFNDSPEIVCRELILTSKNSAFPELINPFDNPSPIGKATPSRNHLQNDLDIRTILKKNKPDQISQLTSKVLKYSSVVNALNKVRGVTKKILDSPNCKPSNNPETNPNTVLFNKDCNTDANNRLIDPNFESFKSLDMEEVTNHMRKDSRIGFLNDVSLNSDNYNPSSFSLNSNGVKIASVFLPKFSYQLGDLIEGRVDFSDAGLQTASCYQISIWFESYEKINEEYSSSTPNRVKELTTTKYSHVHKIVHGLKTVGFSLPTVLNLKSEPTDGSFSISKEKKRRFGLSLTNSYLTKSATLIHQNQNFSQTQNSLVSLNFQIRIKVVAIDFNSKHNIERLNFPVNNQSSKNMDESDQFLETMMDSNGYFFIKKSSRNDDNSSLNAKSDAMLSKNDSENLIKVSQHIPDLVIETIAKYPDLLFKAKNLIANDFNKSPKIISNFETTSNSHTNNNIHNNVSNISQTSSSKENNLDSDLKSINVDDHTMKNDEIPLENKTVGLMHNHITGDLENMSISGVPRKSHFVDDKPSSQKSEIFSSSPHENLNSAEAPKIRERHKSNPSDMDEFKKPSSLEVIKNEDLLRYILDIRSEYDVISLECEIPVVILPSLGAIQMVSYKKSSKFSDDESNIGNLAKTDDIGISANKMLSIDDSKKNHPSIIDKLLPIETISKFDLDFDSVWTGVV